MFRSLQLEWLKFRTNRVFQFMILAYIVLLPSLIFIGKNFKEMPPPIPSNKVIFEFPTVFDYLGYIGSWLAFFFFGFLVIYSITSEYGFKTLRQNIIGGMTRKEFFLSKFSFMISLCFFGTLYFVICATVIGNAHAESIEMKNIFGTEYVILRYLLMCLGYCSFGMIIAFIVRKSGFALFIYFAYIMFIEAVLRWMIHGKLTDNHYSMHFWPMNVVEDLTPLPISKMATEMVQSNKNPMVFIEYNEATIASIIYIILFIGFAYRYFIKADL